MGARVREEKWIAMQDEEEWKEGGHRGKQDP